jgi:D-alanyl-D-alanine carboxypeptidase
MQAQLGQPVAPDEHDDKNRNYKRSIDATADTRAMEVRSGSDGDADNGVYVIGKVKFGENDWRFVFRRGGWLVPIVDTSPTGAATTTTITTTTTTGATTTTSTIVAAGTTTSTTIDPTVGPSSTVVEGPVVVDQGSGDAVAASAQSSIVGAPQAGAWVVNDCYGTKLLEFGSPSDEPAIVRVGGIDYFAVMRTYGAGDVPSVFIRISGTKTDEKRVGESGDRIVGGLSVPNDTWGFALLRGEAKGQPSLLGGFNSQGRATVTTPLLNDDQVILMAGSRDIKRGAAFRSALDGQGWSPNPPLYYGDASDIGLSGFINGRIEYGVRRGSTIYLGPTDIRPHMDGFAAWNSKKNWTCQVPANARVFLADFNRTGNSVPVIAVPVLASYAPITADLATWAASYRSGTFCSVSVPLAPVRNVPGARLHVKYQPIIDQMLDDAHAAGLTTMTFSSTSDAYRNCGAQKNSKTGKAAAPGTSMHQLGVAVDIACGTPKGRIEKESECFKWIDAHKAYYGIEWLHDGRNGPEPWHWSVNGK